MNLYISNMEVKSQTEYIERKFGHCVINWKIDNFCILTCKQCLFICSPEFCINEPQLTKWSMVMRPNWDCDGTSYTWFCLKRLDCGGKDDSLEIYWKLWLLDSKGNSLCVKQSNCVLRKNTEASVALVTTQDVLKKLYPFHSDTLNLRCRLIFKSSTDVLTVEKPRDTGLMALSNDLKVLRSSNDTDISIRIKNQSIQAHRAILCARNNYMAGIINKSRDENVIELPQLDYEAMELVVSYFYSGDLDFVLSKPTVALYECISLLDIDEVKSYYIADELILLSSVYVAEIAFLWVISNFSTRDDDCIFSPVLNSGNSDTNWRLRLYPKGVPEDAEYVSFFADVVEETNAEVVCFEVAIMDEKKEFFWMKRIRKSVTDDNALRLESFIKWEWLENSSLLANDELHVVIKIRESSCAWSSSVGSLMTASVTSGKKEQSYDFLSMNMDFLFRNIYYADVTLQCGGVEFAAHACILASRTRILAEKLSLENKIDIPNIKPKIMYIVLRYIYNGLSRDFEPCDLSQIYEAADILGIPILKSTCFQLMQPNPT